VKASNHQYLISWALPPFAAHIRSLSVLYFAQTPKTPVQ
jgi:hypothetical protein